MVRALEEDLRNTFNLDRIGEILGSGISTIAFRPYNEFDLSSIETPVLVISNDYMKQCFYEELFRGSSVQIEDIPFSTDPDMVSEEEEVLKNLEHEGYHIFYMTRLYVPQKELKIVDSFLSNLELTSDEFYGGSLPTRIMDFSSAIAKTAVEEAFKVAVEFSLKVANDVMNESKYYLDIHPGQFLTTLGGKELFCIDPVLKI